MESDDYTYNLDVSNNDMVIIAVALIRLAQNQPDAEELVIRVIDRLTDQTEAQNRRDFGSAHPWGENNAYDQLKNFLDVDDDDDFGTYAEAL